LSVAPGAAGVYGTPSGGANFGREVVDAGDSSVEGREDSWKRSKGGISKGISREEADDGADAGVAAYEGVCAANAIGA